MAILFLSVSDVLRLHQDQIAFYGGKSGIRDVNLLKSALGTPCATYDGRFLHADIYEMAAAYLFHIVKNHPFIDGNKRIGLIAAFTFLEINGYHVDAPQDVLLEVVLLAAKGELGKAEIAVFIKKWSLKH